MTASIAPFIHDQRPLRVIFEPGCLRRLSDEADRLGLKRILVICNPRYLHQMHELLGNRIADVVDNPIVHVPAEQVAETQDRARAARIDGAVAVGGGSAIGLAKALALRTGMRFIAAPTTYSGSEMTRVWGVTTGAQKTTGRTDTVAPATVLYDTELVASLPNQIAVPSVFNAIAHGVEALYAPDRTPFTDLFAIEGITALVTALTPLVNEDPNACQGALYGAWLCGMCLDATSMGLHHKLCHVLGGALRMPHAQTHTALLPHVLSFNASAIPGVMTTLSERLGVADPADYLHTLAQHSGATMALAQLGLRTDELSTVADMVLAAPYSNPRPVTKRDLLSLLHRALVGAPVR